MGEHEEERVRFEAKVREPYMGNWIPLRFTVVLKPTGNGKKKMELWIINPEGIPIAADQVETFND